MIKFPTQSVVVVKTVLKHEWDEDRNLKTSPTTESLAETLPPPPQEPKSPIIKKTLGTFERNLDVPLEVRITG